VTLSRGRLSALLRRGCELRSNKDGGKKPRKLLLKVTDIIAE